MATSIRCASPRSVILEALPGGEAIEVRGAYRFENTSELPVDPRIYFPFAVDEAHPFPDEISVSVGRHERLRDGILFPVRLAARSEEIVEIRYRQFTRDRSATYIVTSARMWSDPLEYADLLVVTPLAVALQSISYPMDKTDYGAAAADVQIEDRALLPRARARRPLVSRNDTWGRRRTTCSRTMRHIGSPQRSSASSSSEC